MRIDADKCTACGVCIPYCPMNAIRLDGVAIIDQEECVDCNVCLRAKVCPVDCIIYDPAPWPRELRASFSNPLQVHKSTRIAGRGTEEVKTNEVTGRLKPGQLVLAVEMGRPLTGAYFRDVEKVTTALAKLGVHFEPVNPVVALMEDVSTGKLNDEILNEKVLSAIIECIIPKEKLAEVLKVLEVVAREIDTVFSLDLGDLVGEDYKVPMKETLDEMGIFYRSNGKINTGLGRPLYKGGN